MSQTPLGDICSRRFTPRGTVSLSKVRRQIRLVRLRVFTNVRTATRNLDLPLAIRDPRSSGSPYVPKGGFGPVHFCHNGGLSLASPRPMIPPIWPGVKPLSIRAKRALFHPVKCQGCDNGLPRSRKCNRRRFDRQFCPIDLEITNLISTNPLRAPGSEDMVGDLVSLDGIRACISANDPPVNACPLRIGVTSGRGRL